MDNNEYSSLEFGTNIDYDGFSEFEEIFDFAQLDNARDIENDEDLKKTQQNSWAAHSQQYTTLLRNYISNSEKNLKTKRLQKWIFFVASILILIVVVVFSICIMYVILARDSQASSKIIETIPVLLTFLAPLFIFPRLIANNLFTHKDEEYMIEIVKQIIEHDNHTIK